MSMSESCKSRRGGRSKGAGETLVSVAATQPQLGFHAGISIHPSKCDGAAAATEVQHVRKDVLFPPPSNAPAPYIPSTQQRLQGCTSVVVPAAAKGEVEEKAFLSCRTLPPIASSSNAPSPAAAKTGTDAGVVADSQPASKVKSGFFVDKPPETTSDALRPTSNSAFDKTFAPAYNSAAASAVGTAPAHVRAGAHVMYAAAPSGRCETRSDTTTAATTLTPHATAVHDAAGSRVADLPAPGAAPAAAVAAGGDSVSVDARGNVCGGEKCDGIAGGRADQAGAVSNSGAAEETAELKAWERQLLLQSPGALVLQQAPAGVSRAELSEFFRKYGPLQPPGDGLYFPGNRRQQLLVRFQRLQDAAKCARLLQQQQQRRQQVVRGPCGGYDDVVSSGVATRGALASTLNKAAEGGEYGSVHPGLQQQSTDLQDVVQQNFQMPSVSTNGNTTTSRQQGGVKSETCVNETGCCEEGNRTLSSSSFLGCASLQLSRADKIKISALRGHQRAVQLLRSEGILQSVQQQQRQRLHRSEQTRVIQQEGQSQMRKPQEQQTARVSTTYNRLQQITASAKEREGSLLQMRSTSVKSAGSAPAGPAASAQQPQQGYVGTQKAVLTTQEGVAAHSAASRKRGSATLAGTGEKSVSSSRAHTVDEEKEGRVKRRVLPQQTQLQAESTSDAAGVTLTRQQQPKHAASAAAAAAAGATKVNRSSTSAAAANRGKAVRQSSSDSLLELLSGAAVVEHLDKEETAAAAAAGWGNPGTSGQTSKQQQQRSQTAGWGEATVLDPVHDAERIHYLRARSEAAHGAMMGSLAGFLFFHDNIYENFLIPALPRSASFAFSGYAPASAAAYPPPPA